MQASLVERTVLEAGGLAGALFHEAGDGLVVVSPATERVLDANVKACELSEFGRAELIQLPIRGLLRHEQEWQDWLQPVQQTMTYHGKDGFLLRTRDPARWVPVSVSISRLHPPEGETLALFTLRDRREQVEAYRRMQRTEAELRRVLVSVSDCLWSARVESGGRWRFRYLSPVVQRLTGRPVGLFLESPAAREQAVHPRDLARWRDFNARLAAGFSGELEYRVCRPDGSAAWVRENVVVAPDEGGLLLHGVMTDITDRKRAELEQGQHHLAERQRLDGLAALAGKVGDDFSNLITGILGHVSLARIEPAGPAGPLARIEELSLRAVELCHQLGSFGGGVPCGAALHLRPALEQAAARGGARVEGPDGPRVLADPARLDELLARLVANAAEAGGGGCAARTRRGPGASRPELRRAGVKPGVVRGAGRRPRHGAGRAGAGVRAVFHHAAGPAGLGLAGGAGGGAWTRGRDPDDVGPAAGDDGAGGLARRAGAGRRARASRPAAGGAADGPPRR